MITSSMSTTALLLPVGVVADVAIKSPKSVLRKEESAVQDESDSPHEADRNGHKESTHPTMPRGESPTKARVQLKWQDSDPQETGQVVENLNANVAFKLEEKGPRSNAEVLPLFQPSKVPFEEGPMQGTAG
jgi:hypothetical protein